MRSQLLPPEILEVFYFSNFSPRRSTVEDSDIPTGRNCGVNSAPATMDAMETGA